MLNAAKDKHRSDTLLFHGDPKLNAAIMLPSGQPLVPKNLGHADFRLLPSQQQSLDKTCRLCTMRNAFLEEQIDWPCGTAHLLVPLGEITPSVGKPSPRTSLFP